MRTATLRTAFRGGVTASVVQTFFVLIGFNAMLAGILAKILKVKSTGTVPAAGFVVLYCVLLAAIVGFAAARKARSENPVQRLLHGLSSGFGLAIGTLLVNAVFAILVLSQTDPRVYLPQLSLPFMSVTLFNLPPFAGVAANAGIFLAAGGLGAALSLVGDIQTLTALVQKVGGFLKTQTGRFRAARYGKHGILVKWVPLALLAVLVLILPLRWGSYWNYVLGTVGIYVILGLGLNLIVGLSGQLVLGYIAFFAIGAYSVGLLNSAKPHNLMWGFWPGLGIGILLAALAGILLGLPLMRLRGDYLAIVTLGFGEIIRILLKSDMLTEFTGGPRGIQGIQVPKLFGKDFDHIEFTYLILLAVLVSIFVYNRLARSRTGRAWVAIREDETVARTTGVNTVQYKLLALALGAAFAGLAGGIFASRNQFTGPNEHGLMASINVLSLIIVGGLGSVPGTILGAFALKGLPEILREFENYRMVAFGALLVIMMLSRPEGLLPGRRSTLELKGMTSPPGPASAADEEVHDDKR
jgi:ABC-type branched-subunit amino acid transport system permease subunit